MSGVNPPAMCQDSDLRDDIAEALERAGFWRRAATRWLMVFDMQQTERGREYIALRREACLLIASNQSDKSTGARRRKVYQLLLKTTMAI